MGRRSVGRRSSSLRAGDTERHALQRKAVTHQPMRYAPLVLALFFTIVVSAPLDAAGWPRLSATVALPAIFLGGAIAVGGSGRLGRLVVGLWAFTALAELFVQLDSGPLVQVGARVIDAVFLSFVSGIIIRDVVRSETVSTDTILGGICGYMLLGSLFVVLFSILEMVQPGSFLDGGRILQDAGGESRQLGRFPDLTYYSFVTLTTLGYGDVAPHGPIARSLAVAEAIVGQLYLAILVAALVGMHLAQRVAAR